MKIILLLAVLSGTVTAEEVWVLQSGPTAAGSVPLKPIQPVDSWRALYTDADVGLWVYLTRSPNFFPPASSAVRRIAATPWTAVFFFPETWTTARRTNWQEAWQREFLSLSTFPRPGWPVVLPSVLRLPTLSKGP